MTESHSKLSNKDKENLRTQLYKRDGTKCHYCEIEEEDIPKIWNPIYAKKGGKSKRMELEVEHKDGNKENWRKENLVLACAICNISKSNQFTYDEFKKVGNVIREIWQQRKKLKPKK